MSLIFTGHDSCGWKEIMSTFGGRGVLVYQRHIMSKLRDTIRTLEEIMIHMEDIMIHIGDITSKLVIVMCSAHCGAH